MLLFSKKKLFEVLLFWVSHRANCKHILSTELISAHTVNLKKGCTHSHTDITSRKIRQSLDTRFACYFRRISRIVVAKLTIEQHWDSILAPFLVSCINKSQFQHLNAITMYTAGHKYRQTFNSTTALGKQTYIRDFQISGDVASLAALVST